MSEYKAAGAGLVAISPLVPDRTQKLVKSSKLNFNILYDQNNAYAKQLNMVHGFSDALKQVYLDLGLDLGPANGNDHWELPLPTRIVVDQNQTIRAIDINADYTVRPEPAATLQAVKELS